MNIESISSVFVIKPSFVDLHDYAQSRSSTRPQLRVCQQEGTGGGVGIGGGVHRIPSATAIGVGSISLLRIDSTMLLRRKTTMNATSQGCLRKMGLTQLQMLPRNRSGKDHREGYRIRACLAQSASLE